MRAMISSPSSVRPPDPLLAEPPLNDPSVSSAPASRWQIALLWAGVPLCAFGLFHYRLWEHWHSGRFGELLLLSLLAWALSWPLRRFAGWSWASALALPWCLALALFAGVVPVAATLILAATAVALGGMLARRESLALQAACGLALLGGMLGWLLPVPVHYWWSYLCASIVLV